MVSESLTCEGDLLSSPRLALRLKTHKLLESAGKGFAGSFGWHYRCVSLTLSRGTWSGWWHQAGRGNGRFDFEINITGVLECFYNFSWASFSGPYHLQAVVRLSRSWWWRGIRSSLLPTLLTKKEQSSVWETDLLATASENPGHFRTTHVPLLEWGMKTWLWEPNYIECYTHWEFVWLKIQKRDPLGRVCAIGSSAKGGGDNIIIWHSRKKEGRKTTSNTVGLSLSHTNPCNIELTFLCGSSL